ncbi:MULTISPECIES: two-partner secretion domain-containing protein [Nostocales]|uniref:Filamentous hemagglutinin N-terminal domain-containing protein n=3 Tax=Nostocales TaxID=1161 RepID=A0A8S9T4D7_9CYAN|nr:filamentous hemagglutinin N-terminal domain-containing protein [Tolypothrix bouteillei]KAF3886928.1 filamentous hemagglutinin N-terminal domain-containing protein [Tolypothrix bouteillei VB521301]
MIFFRFVFCVSSSLCIFYLAATSRTQAQVVEDVTLPNSSVVTQNGTVEIITGGTQAGSNLFHSFKQFSILTGNTASFRHAPGIANIISRVTGSSVSNINGLIEVLQTDGNPSSANLFLLNPNGIIFGPKASLNLGGSFVSSTANSIKFTDGSEFSAVNPENALPLLTVSVPFGLQFGNNPASIVNQSQAEDANGVPVGLVVQTGKTLALVGGEVELPGGYLTAPDGRIELGSVASSGLVSFTPTATSFALGYEKIQNFGDISLAQEATVDVSGNEGGDVAVMSKNLRVQGGSQIVSVAFAEGKGGMLSVTATEAVELIGTSDDGTFSSALFSEVAEDSGGFGNNLALTSKQLIIRDGARISSSTFGQGQGGNVTVNATTIEVSGFVSTRRDAVSSISAATQGLGHAGSVIINTQQLLLQQGGQIFSSTAGSGQGGNLTINASDSITAIGTSRINKNSGRSSGLLTQTDGGGTAGQLKLETGQLRVLNGAQISTISFNSGSAGNLLAKASTVELAGIALTRDGQVIATDTNPVIPSGLFASADRNSTGNAANLTIETQRLSLRDGAIVQTSTLGRGDAGNLIILASDSIEVTGTAKGGLFPTSILAASGGVTGSGFVGFPEATGKGGNVSIQTGNLTVRDGAQVAVSSLNPTSNAKGAGNLQIQANNIFLDNQGKFNAETASGDGGDIVLQVQKLLLLRNGSQISTSAGTAEQGGDGGNININAKDGFIVAVPGENSDITANAYSGSGGKINITAAGMYGMVQRNRQDLVKLLNPKNASEINPNLLSTNDITAISQTNPNFNGDTSVNTPDTEPLELVPLPVNLVDASQKVATGCTPGNRQARSSFTTIGRGGVAPSPTEPLTQEATIANWIALDPAMGNPLSSKESLQTSNNRHNSFLKNSDSHKIVEAQGWIVDKNGNVILVAQAPPRESSVPLSLLCHAP